MITFYPGPSRIYNEVPKILARGFRDGTLSMNHRSPEFMELVAKTKKVLRKNLGIPKDYEIIFTSSATECWEIFGQSMVSRGAVIFHNGAFGEKWAAYMTKLGVDLKSIPFEVNEPLPVSKIVDAEWICFTQNETSNGTYVSQKIIKAINKGKSKDQLVAVDATSAMGGIKTDYSLGDFWFASVQKCFGLPPGMGLLIVSPAAIRKAEEIGESAHYNSFLNLVENTKGNQTHYTPNIPAIYLLCQMQKKVGHVSTVYEKLQKRYDKWVSFIDEVDELDWLVSDPLLRSPTVLTLKHAEPEKVKEAARQNGIILGNGYGKWKSETFRIANFPAIRKKEIKYLEKFLGGL